MEGEVDPNTVTQEARSGEQRKGELYLQADHKKQKQINGDKRQRRNQGRDKVAKQNTKFKSKSRFKSNMEKMQKIQNIPNREQEHGQNTNNDRTRSEGKRTD